MESSRILGKTGYRIGFVLLFAAVAVVGCKSSKSPTAPANPPPPADTATFTHTETPTPTATSTGYCGYVTGTCTFTFTHTDTLTWTPTPTTTDTPTFTYTFSPTFTFTETHTPTFTPTATETFVGYCGGVAGTCTPTSTSTDTSTETETPTETDTPTDTYTPSETDTPTKTDTPTDTSTPTRTLSKTDTPTLTVTRTSTATRTATSSPTRSPTPLPTLPPMPPDCTTTPIILFVPLYTEAVTLGQTSSVSLFSTFYSFFSNDPADHHYQMDNLSTPPLGMTLNPANGELSGTPAVAGSKVMSICLVDTRGCYLCSPVTFSVIDAQFNVQAQLTGTTPPDQDGYYMSTYAITLTGTLNGPLGANARFWGYMCNDVNTTTHWTLYTSPGRYTQRDTGQPEIDTFTHTMTHTFWGNGSSTYVQEASVFVYPDGIVGQEIRFDHSVTFTY